MTRHNRHHTFQVLFCLGTGLVGVIVSIPIVVPVAMVLVPENSDLGPWLFVGAAVAAFFIGYRIAWSSLSWEDYALNHRICVECGYDLRATPGRCPECGTVPRRSPT